jgi:ribosome-binding factor A
MSSKSRTVRLNSLLKEVISEVIHRDIHHAPHINEFVTITRVEITSDLSFAKVFISFLGSDIDKLKALAQLNHLSAMIAVLASKKVTMRHFPSLTFEVDTGLEKQLRIESMLSKISKERQEREQHQE